MSSPVTVGHIERRQVDQLAAYPSNVSTHSDVQIDRIAASIREFGFVNLIGPDNVIIAGHVRWLAARNCGLREIPVIVLAHLSEAQRRTLVIADNQLALNAGWDEAFLRAELAALVADEFDLEFLGFDDGEMARLLAGLGTTLIACELWRQFTGQPVLDGDGRAFDDVAQERQWNAA